MNIALFTEARESTRWVKDNGVPPGGSLVPGGLPPFLPPSFPSITEGGGIRERRITEVLNNQLRLGRFHRFTGGRTQTVHAGPASR